MKYQILTITLYSMLISFINSFSYITAVQVAIITLHYYIHNSLIDCIIPFVSFGVIFLIITQLNNIQEDSITNEILDKPNDFVLHQMNYFS